MINNAPIIQTFMTLVNRKTFTCVTHAWSTSTGYSHTLFQGARMHRVSCPKLNFYFLWCMIQWQWMNLRYWFVSQFASIVSFHKPLILGSIITRLAIFSTKFHIYDIDLHIACLQPPLDIRTSDDMGLLELKDDNPYFAPPRQLIPCNKRIYNKLHEQ